MTHPRHVANEVARRVREEMTRQGLGNTEIATATGLTIRKLRRRLHHEVEFSVGEIARVAGALGVHPGSLFPTTDPIMTEDEFDEAVKRTREATNHWGNCPSCRELQPVDRYGRVTPHRDERNIERPVCGGTGKLWVDDEGTPRP